LELLLALANESNGDGRAQTPRLTTEKDLADMDLDALVNAALMDDEE
jgi:polyketide synthase 12